MGLDGSKAKLLFSPVNTQESSKVITSGERTITLSPTCPHVTLETSHSFHLQRKTLL